MSEAATAASVYQGLVKNVDPIGAYAAGVQVRAKLEAINAAVPAEIFQNTMNLMKLADARSDRQQRAQLAAKELEIATYNAETNRINANRPRTGIGATGNMGVGATQWRDEGDGSFTPITLGAAQPGGVTSDMPVQMPTSGEGDITSGTLLPGGAAMQGQTGMAPLPGMGAPAQQNRNASGSHIPGVASPFGVAPERPSPDAMGQTAAPPQAKTGLKGTHKLSFTVDAYGRETKRYTPIDPKTEQVADAPVQPAPPEVLAKYSALYDGFGKVAVPTNDKAYPQGFKLEDKPTLHGKSIADLSADEQKRFGDLAQEVLTMTEKMKIATPEAKMAAVGITDPSKMTEELWKKGYQIVQADPNSPGDPQQAALLIQKATQLAAFKNTMLDTNVHGPEMILSQMGVDTKGMMPQAQQQPAGREVAVSGMGQDGGPGQPMGAQATGGASTGVNAQAPASDGLAPQRQAMLATSDNAVAKAMERLNKLTQSGAPPEEITQAKGTLQEKIADNQTLIKTLTKTSGTASAARTASPTSAAQSNEVSEADAQRQLKARKAASDAQSNLPRTKAVQEANTQWEANKDKIRRVAKSTVDYEDFSKDDAPYFAPSGEGGVSTGKLKFEKWNAWLKEHKDRLDIKPMDNKPLTLKSPIFINEDGRTVDLREIFEAFVNDKRTKDAIQSAKTQATGAQTRKENVLPQTQAFLQKAY